MVFQGQIPAGLRWWRVEVRRRGNKIGILYLLVMVILGRRRRVVSSGCV